jgi:O-antigen/teichoic acid export membrane protein
MNFIRGSGIATTGRILGRGIGYLAQITLARFLAPEGFGLFAIGWTILRLFSIAGHLGLDYGVITFGARYWQRDRHKLRNVVILCIGTAFLSGLLFGIALYLFAPWLAKEFFKKPDLEWILRGFAVAFPFATTLRVLAATSSISGRMFYGAFAEDITQPTLQMLLFLALFKMGMGINAAIYSTTTSYMLAVIVGFASVARTIPGILYFSRISLEDSLPILRYSLPAILGATLGAFNLWGDRLMVGYFGTEEQTGVYQSISIITMITTIILSGMKLAIAPVISHLSHNADNESVRILAKSVTRLALYVSMPFLLVVFIAPNDMLITVFGSDYEKGALPLLLLTFGQVFYVMVGLTDQFFLMTGRQKVWLGISSLVFVLTLVFDAIAIPRAGLIGAAIVSSAMMLLLGIFSAMMLRKYLHFWIFDVFHAKLLTSAALAIVVTFVIASNLALGPMLNLGVVAILSTVFFMLFIWITGMEDNDKFIVYQILGRILRIWRRKTKS